MNKFKNTYDQVENVVLFDGLSIPTEKILSSVDPYHQPFVEEKIEKSVNKEPSSESCDTNCLQSNENVYNTTNENFCNTINDISDIPSSHKNFTNISDDINLCKVDPTKLILTDNDYLMAKCKWYGNIIDNVTNQEAVDKYRYLEMFTQCFALKYDFKLEPIDNSSSFNPADSSNPFEESSYIRCSKNKNKITNSNTNKKEKNCFNIDVLDLKHKENDFINIVDDKKTCIPCESDERKYESNKNHIMFNSILVEDIEKKDVPSNLSEFDETLNSIEFNSKLKITKSKGYTSSKNVGESLKESNFMMKINTNDEIDFRPSVEENVLNEAISVLKSKNTSTQYCRSDFIVINNGIKISKCSSEYVSVSESGYQKDDSNCVTTYNTKLEIADSTFSSGNTENTEENELLKKFFLGGITSSLFDNNKIKCISDTNFDNEPVSNLNNMDAIAFSNSNSCIFSFTNIKNDNLAKRLNEIKKPLTSRCKREGLSYKEEEKRKSSKRYVNDLKNKKNKTTNNAFNSKTPKTVEKRIPKYSRGHNKTKSNVDDYSSNLNPKKHPRNLQRSSKLKLERNLSGKSCEVSLKIHGTSQTPKLVEKNIPKNNNHESNKRNIYLSCGRTFCIIL